MRRRFVLATARREARASWRRLALYGACMAFGIAALVALQGVRAAVRHGVDSESRRLLGADLRLTSRTPFDEAIETRLAELEQKADAPAARMTRFGSMALAPASGRVRLADVHALEGDYPFYGGIETDPRGLWPALQGETPLALVDPGLLIQLEAEVGQTLVLGRARFRIGGLVTKAPGSVGMWSNVAPRVFIARRHLAETGLVQKGSLVQHRIYVRVAEAHLDEWLEANTPLLEAKYVDHETTRSYQLDLSRSSASLSRYLALVGLSALLLGGVGVAAGVRVFVREKLSTVAILRSLGARARDVLASYGLLALALGAAAGLAGTTLGAALQLALPSLLQDFLPVEVGFRLEPALLATGFGLGLWVTALFAAGPLLDLARVPPLRALRSDFRSGAASWSGRGALWVALGLSIVAASIWQAPRAITGVQFAGGLAAALAALAGAAAAMMAVLRRHRPRHAPYWLRQGVANLFRPRNHTLSTTLAIGFGLFLVSTLHALQHNILAQIAIESGPDRPNLVLFDVQRDQREALDRFLAAREVPVMERTPLVSARIAELEGWSAAGAPPDEALDRDLRWALRHEYRLTYAAALRPTETVVAGDWWGSEPLKTGATVPVSLEAELAETLDVGLGDPIVWDVQGVRIETVVGSLREVDWDRMATNFFAVFPPGVLEDAPQSLVLLLRLVDPAERAALQRDLAGRFPNISALDATLILRALDAVLDKIGFAVRLMAALTLATGLMILVAAAATLRHERTREALLLRTLGASSRTLRRIIATECFALGALASGVGSGLAIVAAWALARFLFELPFSAPWRDLGLLAGCALAITTLLGWTHGRPALSKSPLAGLRDAECSGGA
jgi:putative ABC transport system permease protein